MTNPITFQDILDTQDDYMANYTTGNVDNNQRMRQANRSIEWWQRRITLPSDKKIQNILFYEDTLFYDTEDDFTEPLGLFYHDSQFNINGMGWEYRPDTEILHRLGSNIDTKYWAFTSINSLKQVMILGPNLNSGAILDPLNVIGSWVAQSDASGLVVDTNQYKEGGASLAFNMTQTVANRGSLYNASFNFDFRNFHQFMAMFKMWVFMAGTNFTTIDLNFFSSVSDYYKITASVQSDGTPFLAGQWNLLKWAFSDAITVGSPNDSAINAIRIDFNEGVGFGSVMNMRVDDLYAVLPDSLDLIYTTNIKGTDSSGLIDKIKLDDPSDIPAFGAFAPDLVDAIAMRGALMLTPQLRKNPEFYNLYIQEVKDMLGTYGKIWPRQRVINMGKTILRKR